MRSVIFGCLAAGTVACGRANFDRVSATRDGGGDAVRGDGAAPGPLQARLIRNAYYDSAVGTAGMSVTGFSISTAGVADGDLVLFIANADNGCNNYWPLPAAGFVEVTQNFYGMDGQTFVVAQKIASGEPATYTGTYAACSSSGAVTISLVAIAGAAPIPLAGGSVARFVTTTANPADVTAPNVVIAAPDSLVLYAAGADWTPANGVGTLTPPLGFTVLTDFGDRDTSWLWTSQAIATASQATPGPTGILPATYSATPGDVGAGWCVLLGIPPT